MRKKIYLIAVLLVVAIIAVGFIYYQNYCALGTKNNPIIMSFVPSGDKAKMTQAADNLAVLLSKKTGYSFKAQVDDYYEGVLEAMGSEKTHIGWLNTFNYLLARKKYNVEPALVIVRQGVKEYKGQIVVNKNSGIDTLQDLERKTICWVDNSSTSGYIMPRLLLRANDINPDSDLGIVIFAGSHTEVISKVYNGECDAGATYIDAREAVIQNKPDIKDIVTVLATTDSIPNDNVSFIQDFPDKKREKIIDALIEIVITAEGKEYLKTLASVDQLERVDDSFYDNFRESLKNSQIEIEELAD